MWGSLQIVVGPMRSNKTGWLNDQLNRYCDIGKRVLRINHSSDHRDDVIMSEDERGTTHNSAGLHLTNGLTVVCSNNLTNINIDNYDVIGIDEAQFFPNLVSTIVDWLQLGKIIKVVGLDGDSNCQPFGEVLKLIPYAYSVEKKLAYCQYCINDNHNLEPTLAPYTKRIIECDEQILVGGDDYYVSVCGNHL